MKGVGRNKDTNGFGVKSNTGCAEGQELSDMGIEESLE